MTSSNVITPKISTPATTTLNEGMARSSDLWFYPGEELPTNEMRVSLIGTGWGNIIRPIQKGPSIFVELGSGENFVFDVGPGCGINYNVMQIPFSKIDHIFLTHLHTDHTSDLGWIYTFGPSGDRFSKMYIYGPHNFPGNSSREGIKEIKGSEIAGSLNKSIPDLHEFVEGMQKFTDWHTISFAATLNIYEGYNIEVHPLNYLDTPDTSGKYKSPKPKSAQDYGNGHVMICEAPGKGIAYHKTSTDDDGTTNTITIQHWPALHIIDGAISYRLDWKRTASDGTSQNLSVVLSGDTQPNHYMMEYAKGVDLLIHETAPTSDRLSTANDVTASQASTIIALSHTPSKALGKILQSTNPKLAVTSHCPIDPEEWQGFVKDVQSWWPGGAYQMGEDLMVFNIKPPSDSSSENSVIVRKGGVHDRPWGVCLEQNTHSTKGPSVPTANYQSDKLFKDHVLSSSEYDLGWADWATGDYNNCTSIHQVSCPEGAKIVALEAYNQANYGLVNIRFGYVTSDKPKDIQWSDWATSNKNGTKVGPVSVTSGDYATGIKVRYQKDDKDANHKVHDYGLVNACLVDSSGADSAWVDTNPRGMILSSIAPTDSTYIMTGLQYANESNHGLVDVSIAYKPAPTSDS